MADEEDDEFFFMADEVLDQGNNSEKGDEFFSTISKTGDKQLLEKFLNRNYDSYWGTDKIFSLCDFSAAVEFVKLLIRHDCTWPIVEGIMTYRRFDVAKYLLDSKQFHLFEEDQDFVRDIRHRLLELDTDNTDVLENFILTMTLQGMENPTPEEENILKGEICDARKVDATLSENIIHVANHLYAGKMSVLSKILLPELAHLVVEYLDGMHLLRN